MTERSATAQGRLRRLNLVTLLPMLAVVGTLLVVVDAHGWWQAAALSLSVVTALVASERWATGAIARVALPCLLVTGAVWALGALVIGSRTSFYGLSVVGPLVIAQLPRRRFAAALALAVFVAAVGAARLLVPHENVLAVVIAYILIPTGAAVLVTGAMLVSQRLNDLVAELEQSREREAELAVIRERMRFASDLHDIQGHTLHVVKLKVALAEKLVPSDLDRVQQELREVHVLVGDTIAQTKELAYAQRRLNLSAELENAKNLFEAAGIRVRVDRGAEVDTRAGELLGQVLRETTTNILRHAQAQQVRITLSQSGISIVNDGAQEGPLPELRGLSNLRQRLADNEGELTVEQQDGRFLTGAAFPHLRPAPPAKARKGDR